MHVVQEIPETERPLGLDGGLAWRRRLHLHTLGRLGLAGGAQVRHGRKRHSSPLCGGTSSENLGFGSGSPIVTSNGTAAGSGIVWISDCSNPPGCEGSTLNAYGAVPVEGSPHLLWHGEIGVSTKFARPDASGGRIYVGTYDGHLLGFGATHHTLAVRREGEAGGSVSSNVSGIECGSICSHSFTDGAQVTLSATPIAHFEFTGWSGGGCSGTGACDVTMYSDTTVTATFARITHNLTVSKSGSGSGTVTSEPAGIGCGAICSARFDEASNVSPHRDPESFHRQLERLRQRCGTTPVGWKT